MKVEQICPLCTKTNTVEVNEFGYQASKHQRINPRLYRFIKKGDLNRLAQVIKGK